MSLEIQGQIPDEFTIGDDIQFLKTVPNCPASEGGTLTYYFVKKDGTSNTFNVVAEASNDDFLVDITAAKTAALTAGEYSWRARFVDPDSKTLTIEEGSIILNPDYSSAVSTLSDAQQIVDAIDAQLKNTATPSQKRFKVRDREVEQHSQGELLALRTYYRQIVKDEKAEEALKQGKANPNKVRTRLTNN